MSSGRGTNPWQNRPQRQPNPQQQPPRQPNPQQQQPRQPNPQQQQPRQPYSQQQRPPFQQQQQQRPQFQQQQHRPQFQQQQHRPQFQQQRPPFQQQQQRAPYQQQHRPQFQQRPSAPLQPAQPLPKPVISDEVTAVLPGRIKRPANVKAPGTPVMLWVNLFQMSIKQKKPIYQYNMSVESTRQTSSAGDPTESKARKIGSKIRLDAGHAAVKQWVARDKPGDFSKQLTFNYVFDSNGSVMYALFDMFKGSSQSSLDFMVTLQLENIREQKLCKTDSVFEVKFHKEKTGALNLQNLFDKSNSKEFVDSRSIQHLVRALMIILRGQINTLPNHVITKFNIFPYERSKQKSIAPGILLNSGFSLGVRLTEKGVNVNIANTFAAFHEEVDLIDMLRQQYRVADLTRPLEPYILEKLNKDLKNKQVEARHINYGKKDKPHYRKYRVSGIGGSSEDKFTLVDKEKKTSQEVTIANYFDKTYKVKIKYRNLPCIIDSGRKVPIELCHLIDKQRVLRKATQTETQEIIRVAAVGPQEYFDRVQKNLDVVSNNIKPLKDFGLDLEPKPIQVEGRQLDIMPLKGKRDVFHPNRGQYFANDAFVRPAKDVKWILAFVVGNDFNPKINEQQIKTGFCKLYCEHAKTKGITVGDAEQIQFIQPTNRNPHDPKQPWLKILDDHIIEWNKSGIDQAVVVCSEDTMLNWVYDFMKYGEVRGALLRAKNKREGWTRTCFIKYRNFVNKILNSPNPRSASMFISNLWLKHNSKLGGFNYILARDHTSLYGNYLADGVLFVSMDVCHPAPGDTLFESVAAVFGFWDLNKDSISSKIELRVQKKQSANQSTREDIADVGMMFGSILDGYKAKKGKLPTRIIILRDGVSEGQFHMVSTVELVEVKKMLKQRYGNGRPPITCLVVQKRHSTKFKLVKPVNIKGVDDYNMQPGTVVNSDIVYPHDNSYYSCPHLALKGTAKPPLFHLISNENQFSADELESMTLALSYLSPRCTKGTSIPTPINLADLAAERGKKIVVCHCEREKLVKNKDTDKIAAVNKFLESIPASYKSSLFFV